MILSVFVALILTPALCATMLKPVPKGSHGVQTGFFGWFNRTFEKVAITILTVYPVLFVELVVTY